MRPRCERLSYAPPQLVVVPCARAPHGRPGLHVRDRCAGGDDPVSLPVDELQDPSPEQLDLALPVPGLCILVRVL